MLNFPLQNIANDGHEIYLFNRLADGNLSIMKDTAFFPYFYKADVNGIYCGYFGGKFNRVTAKEPYFIKDMRNIKVDGESDIIYTRRYLLDKVNIIKSKTKWIMFDIETKSKVVPNPMVAPDPITSIAAYDNYSKEYKQFWAEDYKTEYDLIDAFINYIIDKKPDLMIAYNVENFDAPYLINRFPDFSEKISPIHKKKYRNQYPEGISIVDYYKLIKKVYKYKRNTLDYIYSEEFNVAPNNIKYRFDVISPIIREKNLDDVKKMVALENKLHLIDYFDEQRRLAKVLWEDLCNYSVSIDGLILQMSKAKGVVLPSKPDNDEQLRRKEEDEITGGFVYAKKGRYENVSLFDISGTYPSMITTFNLDPVNLRDKESTNTIKIKNVIIEQNPNAIVPTVSRRLIGDRAKIQKELEKLSGLEYDLVKKQDDAHKSLNNTLYGILLFKGSRIYNKDIASTITYLARFMIRYTKYALHLLGYEVVGSDTDSIFVHSENYQKISDVIKTIIIPRWLNHFGKKDEGQIKFKYEGTFENVIFTAKKHYKGNMIKANGEHKSIDKGIEIVRRDTSKFQEKFLEELYNKILSGLSQETVNQYIKIKIDEIKNAALKDIAFPFQLNTNEYSSEPIFMRALHYTDEIIPNFSKDYHDELYYIYVKSFGTSQRQSSRMLKNKETGKRERKESITTVQKNVLAFDVNDIKHIKEVDYEQMIERNILKKVKTIYEALNWDFTVFVPKKEKKTRKTRTKKEKSSNSYKTTDELSKFAKEEASNNAEERALNILDNKDKLESYYEE